MLNEKKQGFRVCLTGGGTAGHVTPHFALLPAMRARGWTVFYVGSAGLEGKLVADQGIEFHAIATGKLRRYASWRNFVDLFKVGIGCLQAFWLLWRKKPDVLFSKGGFVAVPVAWAAWVLRIPVISHESDVTPGLANRLIKPVARKLLYTFPETSKYLSTNAEQVGTPIRPELFAGDKIRGRQLCGFTRHDLPTILVMGGSQGAQRINDSLLAILPWLVERAMVVHLTGPGKGIGFIHPHYKSFEFVTSEMRDIYALADFVIGRAGANSLFEVLALRKPMLLIPLEQGSRGDQVINAASFERQGWALVLREKDLNPESFKAAISDLMTSGDTIRKAQSLHDSTGAADRIIATLGEAAGLTVLPS
ncbi:MAG: undecaprenyldiphospho-muramoylpentapeptide beta-N-acetylglucosaminyltransferase [Deltaproteobacteria bacterium]|nr:undecaprenyldiphospho-muramoylpentapeptide beta-N-acetylglucosaminyltransferase [Deltaproteobacteria bacterium]